VLRVFQNADIIHVENSVDALRDLDIILTELILKDLEAVEKRFAKAEAEARTGKKEAIVERDELAKIKKLLEEGKPADRTIGDLNLLTAKRRIFLLNGRNEDVAEDLRNKIQDLGGYYIVADLSSAEGVPDLIKKAYEVLGLISFFTTGEDETRAWTIERGALAPQAAGVIHTDFEKKFIRMEVVASDKLLEAQGWTQAKQKGWVRVEGKEYEVKDGDVIVVRHG
jgi:ribosome-binding ATPase YchF (GTP1/OBG family)